jgi:hypothetical protein
VTTLESSGSMEVVGFANSVSLSSFLLIGITTESLQLPSGMAGDEPLCSKALLSGYTVDGSFQQYAIGKAAHVARIPKEVPLDAIAPVLCAGITVCLSLP